MRIKGADGHDYNVASQAVGGTGLGFGIAGTALGLLNGGLGGILGGPQRCAFPTDAAINRYEAELMISNSAKDSEIALLKADKYTDQKIVEATQYLDGKINSLAAEVRANKEAQNAVNMEQAVYNGVNTATVQCIKNQVEQLYGITKLVVPNTAICPGWGNITVTPAAATATT